MRTLDQPMRVLVVDDEPLARRGVIRRLAEHPDVIVVGEAEDSETARMQLTQLAPDLVFMDIEMPGISGLDVLRDVARDDRPLIVFLTAYEQFALGAFEVSALDYLLKPVDDLRFDEALSRSRQMLAQRRLARNLTQAPPENKAPFPDRFMVREGNRSVFVSAGEIEWVEAMGDYAGLHVKGKAYLLRETVHNLLEKLDPSRFVRIHRSTIVRVDLIADIKTLTNKDSLLRLLDGTPLRVSRSYSEALRDVLRSQR
ncbi:response regulator transcription factor [Dyella flava]|uniref:Response regulator transcription factor n=3 Tax=Dyella flava TaxID=1920170 RepID=A0ABS2K1N4_9GAMM|nr:LytTR family DNA-binding domain-containing protein [Dyella flava]MBM7124223.1 response regulator transcription factor [Dyella flava]